METARGPVFHWTLFGVVSMDSQVETVPGPQPQRGPPPATGVSDPEHVAGKGQSRATGYNFNWSLLKYKFCNATSTSTFEQGLRRTSLPELLFSSFLWPYI